MTRSWLLVPGSWLAATILAPGPAAAQEPGIAPHSVDGLEEMSRPLVPKPATLFGVLTGAGTVPADPDFDPGWEALVRGGVAVTDGLFLSFGGSIGSNEAEPTGALSGGEFYQGMGLLGVDWVLPLEKERYGTSLRLTLAAGVVRGWMQRDKDDRKALRESQLRVKQGLWGGVLRPGISLDVPIGQWKKSRYFVTFGAEYVIGWGESRTTVRDKTGAQPTIRDRDRVGLSSFHVFLGLTARA
ncbi:MAG: hypothetical protein L0216_18455 [Planctomycetales bacterium]|nr:hypothetical protein [Planctomycetales bacterium]